MSRLEELIQELCPDGVEYKKLHDVSEMKRGISVTKKDITEGEIPVISGGKEPAYYCDNYNRNGETITVAGSGAGAGFVQYWDKPIFVCDAFSIKGYDNVLTKYLYYCLSNLQEFIYSTKKGGGVPHVHISSIENIKIPVPPLPIQREIVRILDNFTELTAELTARKKQYEYYRNHLLERDISEKRVTLGTVCEVYDGTHQTPEYTDNGVPFVSVEDIDNLHATKKFISPEAFAKFKIKPHTGDLFMTRITAGIIGKCAVVDSDDDLAYYVSLALLRPNQSVLNSRYLKHYLESGLGRVELAKRILWDATPTKINKDDIGKVFISLPPLDVQERLVNILDNFDTICSDLSIGLPAEIEARQKQYEYYRDKLLTFKEKIS
ncbi:MAG: restriction endonuclease subunit S [Clostridiales bacterium]|nr:restriction endonuclease subunit S [Clostridiales bacterium]